MTDLHFYDILEGLTSSDYEHMGSGRNMAQWPTTQFRSRKNTFV